MSDQQPRPRSNDILSFLNNPTQIPCFRRSMMWGIGTSLVLGGQNYLRFRDAPKASRFGMGCFLLVGLGNYALCRARWRNQLQRGKAFFGAQTVMQQQRGIQPSTEQGRTTMQYSCGFPKCSQYPCVLLQFRQTTHAICHERRLLLRTPGGIIKRCVPPAIPCIHGGSLVEKQSHNRTFVLATLFVSR